jgi:hypothetical protein
VKTFLATATDSAAMGGIRALERGVSYTDQATEVQRTTQMLFDANFPDNLLMTGNSGRLSQNVVVAGYNMDPNAGPMFEADPGLQPGMREIRVLSEAEAPTFFMRIFGVDSVMVRAGAYAARRDVNIMVVIDRSGSLKKAGAWGAVQDASVSFIEQFDNNRDRVGVITFGTNANIDVPLGTGFKTNDLAKNVIMSQTVPDGAGTNAPLGLWLAYSELLRVNDPDALNSIVLFTDGQPSAFTATFRTRTSAAGSGKPYCNSSSKVAAIATIQSTTSAEFNELLGFWNPAAGPAPVRNGATDRDYELVSGCNFNGDVNASAAEWVFDPGYSWPATWSPQQGGIARTFCIQPGAVSCLGDAADFSYSISDARLYRDNNNTSEDIFRGTNVHNAAKNLMLNISQTARQDATLGGIIVHGIGMGGWGYPADHALMKRIANDPTDSYGVVITPAADEPQGSYNYAPSAAELKEAFSKVRSEVMRLTR